MVTQWFTTDDWFPVQHFLSRKNLRIYFLTPDMGPESIVAYLVNHQLGDKIQLMPKPLEFIRSVKVELGQVKWPSRQQTFRLTLLVVGISISVGLYTGALDMAFTSLLGKIINR